MADEAVAESLAEGCAELDPGDGRYGGLVEILKDFREKQGEYAEYAAATL